MTAQTMSLPINIPWKLVAASPDMMDIRPNNAYPPPWRSSLAVYAYEPKPDELDPALCDQQIAFIKVTASITGIQLSDKEAEVIEFLNEALEVDLDDVLEEYLACYGALINISVFPLLSDSLQPGKIKTIPLERLPRIIDLEPKKRDLYQAATETGEILTASRSAVQTGKSMTDTLSSETGISLGTTNKRSLSAGAEGVSVGGEVSDSAGLSHKWGETSQDTRTLNTDSSRESRETHGTTTNLTQMYNLLTGYHAGTNRATFFIQARPHTLQATDRRTFVNGVREIEGLQDFFLVISKPKGENGLCVKATIETGHFPENVREVPVSSDVEAKTGEILLSPPKVEDQLFDEGGSDISWASGPLLEEGWEFDMSKGDSGHPGVMMTRKSDDNSGDTNLPGYNYQVEGGKLIIQGSVIGSALFHSQVYHREYTVFVKEKTSETRQADRTQLVISQRRLRACYTTDENGCVVARGEPEVELPDFRDDDFELDLDGRLGDDIIIDDEPDFPFQDLFRPGKSMDTRTFYRRMRAKMMGSFRSPTRRKRGPITLLDTDYFTRLLAGRLPRDLLTRPLKDIEGFQKVDPKILSRLGKTPRVADVLKMSLPAFVRKTGLDYREAIRLRRAALGLPQEKGPSTIKDRGTDKDDKPSPK